MLIDMPRRGVASQSFDIEEVDIVAPERGGRLGGISLGFPIWRASWTLTRSMTEDLSDEWTAFVARCRGSKRPFLVSDRARQFPARFPEGFSRTTRADGTPFSGAARGWSQAITGDGDAVLSLEGLPSGMSLRPRDHVGFKWDAAGSPAGAHDRRTVARVVDVATADATGSLEAIIEPPLPIGVVPASAIAHLDSPACIMRMIPGSAKLGAVDVLKTILGGSFEAVQDLRP